MENIIEKVRNFPQAPGVYVFRGAKKEILYIGKATNLRSRAQSYFRGTDSRGERIESMVSQAADVEFQQTDSVLEALILESNLIKKHQPKYNIMEKDDKSFAYFVVTKEEFPRVVILRKTDLLKISNFKFQIPSQSQIINDKLQTKNFKYKDILIDKYYGPYISKYQMEIALKIIRRIFPFHSNKAKTEKGCLDFQLGKCPGPYADAISKEDYKKNIRGIRMILEGKKKRLVTTLEKEMEEAAKKNEFEKAAELRNKVFALNHIRDIALLGREFESEFSDLKPNTYNLKPVRIEAYDISNISGKQAVGSMVVFSGKNPDKSQYRKFKIKSVEGPDDVAMMREVLARRIGNDWPRPDLVLLDGGQGHLNAIVDLFEVLNFEVAVMSVAKGESRKNLNFQFPISNQILMSKFSKEVMGLLEDKNFVKHIMDEAHRFAIGYHRKLRRKDALK
ncbi:MAG TPA: hypothetical protein DCX32_02920 [Candidatus Moranbacteria bacterium]|nr:MAG: Excinuclease ABC C subunit domain protein [Parcubacteria group bacterium GW2011_GWC1_45_14]HAV11472.1 hypothetical protein [Candidatus Moranbacteria bacterium]